MCAYLGSLGGAACGRPPTVCVHTQPPAPAGLAKLSSNSFPLIPVSQDRAVLEFRAFLEGRCGAEGWGLRLGVGGLGRPLSFGRAKSVLYQQVSAKGCEPFRGALCPTPAVLGE